MASQACSSDVHLSINWPERVLYRFNNLIIFDTCIPGGPLVFQGGYHPRKTTFKKHPKHVFFQVWKYTLNTYFLAFSLP